MLGLPWQKRQESADCPAASISRWVRSTHLGTGHRRYTTCLDWCLSLLAQFSLPDRYQTTSMCPSCLRRPANTPKDEALQVRWAKNQPRRPKSKPISSLLVALAIDVSADSFRTAFAVVSLAARQTYRLPRADGALCGPTDWPSPITRVQRGPTTPGHAAVPPSSRCSSYVMDHGSCSIADGSRPICTRLLVPYTSSSPKVWQPFPTWVCQDNKAFCCRVGVQVPSTHNRIYNKRAVCRKYSNDKPISRDTCSLKGIESWSQSYAPSPPLIQSASPSIANSRKTNAGVNA